MNSHKVLCRSLLACCLGITMLSGCEHEEQEALPDFTEYLKTEDGMAQYALDESTNLYRYRIESDDKGAEVPHAELLTENTGGIERFIPGDVPLLLTKSHALYADPGEGKSADEGATGTSDSKQETSTQSQLVQLFENVEELYIEDGAGTLGGAMVMTQDRSLYGWPVGGDLDSKSASAKPPLLLEKVERFEHPSADGTEAYYGSAALTEAGELYVWDFERSYKDADTGESVDYRVDAPTLRLGKVNRFDLQPQQIIAHTNVGEVIVNEDEFLNE
ncbi:hypothetical protein [Saccharibacillus qingshengii]|uniref:hypothetical protein n=1 Tax=Saccharibacillus qingshengii TaxID=1763540 RepID=UPI001553EDA6|nr:hypothetical protein [Saccharibacillus qingshengii]